jgi:hypothetical protein
VYGIFLLISEKISLHLPGKNISGALLFNRILLAGFIAGTLDAAAAIINFYITTGKSPVIVFVYIASAVFGKEAYSMSQFIAVIGLLFHYLVANVFSAFYFLIYPKIKFLHWNKITNAIIYGIFVWLVMNLLVVPLSRAQHFPFNIRNAILGVFILIICIGIPITMMASLFYRDREI